MELGPHEIGPPIAEKLLEAGGYLGIERVFFFSRNVAVAHGRLICAPVEGPTHR